ncbi:MAG: SDR family NAD(P)-dependent oxidoreductase [Burkholderiaceae bacterium]|nr:SDR family NAD(P)-dependent oxidoreductase [Rhodoferax sp.]MCP5286155.1 SDR family NAD(P)-dependent oxidoreductase [Burkholderiaceae bacterium]
MFHKFVLTPAGHAGTVLATAAARSGAVGVVDAEFDVAASQTLARLQTLGAEREGTLGVRLGPLDAALWTSLASRSDIGWLIVDQATACTHVEALAAQRVAGKRVLLETTETTALPDAVATAIDGLLLKGNEAGGFVGDAASFILMQWWLARTSLPLYLRGGVSPGVAAACAAVGMKGVALDSQLLCLDEAGLPPATRNLLANLGGSETVAVGDGETGSYFRLLVRPGQAGAKAFVDAGDGQSRDTLTPLAHGRIDWAKPQTGLLPLGQDVCFAGALARKHGRLASVLAEIDAAVAQWPGLALAQGSVLPGAALAQALGTRLPVIQGPMTRVSDVAEFAQAIANDGALPMVAFALLKGKALEELLQRSATLLADKPWGIGLLGFAPQALLDEQLAMAGRFKPSFAIIAGGRPDQAVHLERSGIPSFLHVPSANLIGMFMQEGARRFIFEGRECGGHIGPLSSFVLWSTMIDRLLTELGTGKVPAAEVQVVFAGGIHDATSSAMLQVMAAPLAALGVKVGILMGSAYLFTREIVASGAVVQGFQQAVIDCERTVNLESGPGHASRCAYTPFAADFFRQRKALKEQRVPADEARAQLDDLILGRLRIASKGRNRHATTGELQTLDGETQLRDGMYMLGQVALLRGEETDIASVHRDVTEGAQGLLRQHAAAKLAATPAAAAGQPADVAIVGMACLLPGSRGLEAYWENILGKVDAITEIPAHRWDWRLYFSEDRHAKDKIYSRWGGFLEDMAFDPMRYGMPPKSIESVDPMQLMALEVARRALADAGYDDRPFDRERASIIVGASGGTGDVGQQYGLRAELPRFQGDLPADVADRLPEWTEDSFAGILLNVIAGRIANRLNFGGVNFTTDAACASSLAAVYQGVTELVAGRSDIVIAGGVDTVQGPFAYLCFSKTQALSPRGRCSTFDAEGDGIAISEGMAMVTLKRLADAERDGDRIYAVIKGVGGSSDGNAKGMTAPLPAGQLRAMRRAYAMAGFGPSSVGLFEAHGTGTVAGDTAELQSTTQLMLEEGAAPRRSVIGSVKTNIGHTKASAGIAGMIKAALSLHHRVLPPHRNVRVPNAVLRDPANPLYLLDEARPWLAEPDRPRRAAISAFGFGGTNFHVVLEAYSREYRPWLTPPPAQRRPAELLLWSAADRPALQAALRSLHDGLADVHGLELRDLAASLAQGWQAGASERLAIVARDVAEARQKMAAAAAWLDDPRTPPPPGVSHGIGAPLEGQVALLFPGQGSQYPEMAREAALHFPACAAVLAEADRVLAPAFGQRFGAGTRLSEFILPRGGYDDEARTAAREALTRTDVAQPALGAVEAGLLAVLRSMGLQGDMAAGHSYGEFVALHAAGVIGFDDLMALSAARGRFIVDAAAAQGAELGTMAAVTAPRKDVEDAIADIDGVLIANHNAPQQCILSGTQAAVAAAAARLAQAGLEATPIPVAAAFHSPLVRPAQQALGDLIELTPFAAPAFPVYSNTTARAHASDVGRIRKQMAEHLVKPVEFVAQVEAMHADGARIFVEIGPKAVLSRLVGRILGDKPHLAVAVDEGGGLVGLLGAVGRLLCAGLSLDPAPLFAGRDVRVGDLSQPATLLRLEPVSRHAWMLNGSRARRASDPVPTTVGVTLEVAQARASAAAAEAAAVTTTVAPALAPSAPAAPAAQVAATALAASASSFATQTVPPRSRPAARQISNPSYRRGRPMDERRPGAGIADPTVMSDYFDTMRQFLETQERVMASYLGSDLAAAAPRPALRPRSVPLTLPRAAEVMVPSVPVAAVAMPPAAVPAAPVSVVPPVAAPAAAVPVAAAPVSAPAPVTAAAPTPVAKPAAAASGALGREAVTDLLLSIVEEKTGYPRDMVGLEQNLESDLGIDSIKRIEVVGTLLQKLPDAQREALKDSRSKLNTQPSLSGMLDIIGQVKVEGAAVPFDVAGAGVKVERAQQVLDHPSRHVMRAEREPLDATHPRRLTPGRFLIVPDAAGLAPALAAQLRATGVSVDVLPPMADEAALDAALADLLAANAAAEPVAGVVHLAGLAGPELDLSAGPSTWRPALWQGEELLYVLVRQLGDRLHAQGHVMAVSGWGGYFARGGTGPAALKLTGGAVGALKSLQEERPGLRVRAVDLDLQQPPERLASLLAEEIAVDGGRIEVGYPAGLRTVFRTVEAKVPSAAPLRDVVVLATGGARGITAEVLRELALPGNVLVLTGRSALQDAEPPEIAACVDAAALQRHYVGEIRAGRAKMTPGDVQRKVQAHLGAREMRANLADFRAGGAQVEYHAVDVNDAAALQRLVADLVTRHGRIDGVVHGAGVIEDKRWADKTRESWARVLETKVFGLLQLAAQVDAAKLKFFVAFSSVAGRYGNSGQSDYATANELMNRLCDTLQHRWGPQVVVRSLCWGPWGPTKFGAGMVTAETEAKFAEKGVYLVHAAEGRALFRDALVRAPGDADVEIVCGAGPWEAREAEVGAFASMPANAPVPVPAIETTGQPLLGAAQGQPRPTGEQDIAWRLDPARHHYLLDHVFDGQIVLPAAVALEALAEAVQGLYPGWQVTEVRDHRLLKGVDLRQGARDLRITVAPAPYGSSEGFEVAATLQSELAPGRWVPHYRATVRLEQGGLPEALPVERSRHADRALTADQAYGDWLCHGPILQLMDHFEGLSPAGAAVQVRSTLPSAWLTGWPAEASNWLFDPGLLDAAAQLAWVWARAYRDETALPARFGRVLRFAQVLPAQLRMQFDRVEVADASLVRANVYFLDDKGRCVLMIEDLESIGSAALNRIGGQARRAEVAQ